MSLGFILIVLLVGLLLVALAGGAVLWFLRRRSANQKTTRAAKKKSEKRKPKKLSPKEQATGQSQAAVAEGQPASQAAPAETPTETKSSTPTSDPTQPEYELDQGEKIRILIVDDNPDTRGHVSRLLYFEDNLEVVGQAINGREGVEMAIELKPHLVLMDINMPDMDGITATREMVMKAPFSQVIIMSVQAEQHYMKQAMAAGARDFQPKPFTSEELIGCVRRVFEIGQPTYRQYEALQQAEAQQTGGSTSQTEKGETGTPIIVVYSPKGGVGTSTLAANLAVALQRAYGEVVLMDGNLQFGDVLVHLNTRPSRTVHDIIHEEMADIELLPDVLLPHSSGLKLLLGPPQPEMADAVTPEMVGELVEGLKENARAVVVDTPGKLDDKMMAILERADYILLVSAPELPAVKSTKLFLEVVDALGLDSRLGVVINRADQPGGISVTKIEKLLKLERTFQIPYDPRLGFSINRGVVLTQQEPNSPSARAIIQMAQEIGEGLIQPPEMELMVEES